MKLLLNVFESTLPALGLEGLGLNSGSTTLSQLEDTVQVSSPTVMKTVPPLTSVVRETGYCPQSSKQLVNRYNVLLPP